MKGIVNLEAVVVPLTHAPNANAAAVITVAALASIRTVVDKVWGGYDLTPNGVNGSLSVVVTVLGSLVTLAMPVPAAGPVILDFKPPIQGDVATAITITLATGGVGVTGKINALTR